MFINEIYNQIILTNGENLIVYNKSSEENQLLDLPPLNLPKKANGAINSISFSRYSDCVAVSTEAKQIVIYNKQFEPIANFAINRIASKVIFAPDYNVIVADKTGDVYLYSISHANVEPKLLLGHLSMILDVVLSECGKYLITCDRDEKIRVSEYPNTYNIVNFCLGHTEFITKLVIGGDVLFSASGDGTIGVWNYLQGENISFLKTGDFVEDKSFVDAFCKEMDAEKVDVTALPVSDLQIRRKGDDVLLFVQLHTFNGVLLFTFNFKTSKTYYLNVIKSVLYPFSYCLTDTLLYILDVNGFYVYKLKDNGDCESASCPGLEKMFSAVVNKLQFSNNSITILYKRKFDNVKEYLARKKMRLEAN